MANTLRSDFPPATTEVYPPLNAPKTAAMRRAEREEKKAAKARARESLRIARQAAMEGLRAVRQRVQERAIRPGYSERVARCLIRRWYGTRAEDVPLVMLDYRYWQALSCGWQPMTRKDDEGSPMGPLADWYGWWCGLHYRNRDAIVRMSRLNGKGIRRA